MITHVFFLAKLEQMPYAEIARMLQISLPTVNYHIGYAMNALRKRLVGG
ncbi:sigma factor-like helix-turn-helix DNA-binding protein [Bacteroides acidifaciens]|nr:sigma factor-like helix-turn-helix DNA-binding protein [Bacteroides acidifaciens]